jgi:hypothetical protein
MGRTGLLAFARLLLLLAALAARPEAFFLRRAVAIKLLPILRISIVQLEGGRLVP